MEKQIKIATEKLCFSYNNRCILNDIDLELPENSIIAVTGPSGTGKSTFLSIFNRLWEEHGDGTRSGTVSIRFKERLMDIYQSELAVTDLRRRVGMVFQAPNPLPVTIFKNIAFPLLLNGQSTKTDVAEKVEKILRKVHLFDEIKDRLQADARTLSGGQQQRLCIARALMLEPEILLLDEPTSSLDTKACGKIETLLSQLKKSCTLLMVSHYQDQVQRVADRVYELTDKQLQRTL